MPEVKERPILFSAPMVRAILEGRKTVTRRALNTWALKNIGYGVRLGECNELPTEGPLHPNSVDYYNDLCPFGQPGDRLWVRETCFINDYRESSVPEGERADCEIHYSADGIPDFEGEEELIRWRPSIHMPRWASRILLEITDVRVERLQDGDGKTAFESRYIAEGINRIHQGDGDYAFHPFKSEPGPGSWTDPFDAWRELWVGISGAESWNSNPWVWCVSFRRVEQ
ncbi:hypothetical protein [Pseudomonas tolaasii]|uniref:hypothetical protein n=1 Tax=Pseudomonas tolaasii TaxID=29442 RepID=UPI001C5F7984|nr:hypothetical protein [Pseudomonas tolaasii]MBW4793802.1 hypothetical protein [Pseudomonas tolaasii]